MSAEKHSKKEGKKEKSSHSEKKRKREYKEGEERTKSKKHRSLKQTQQPEIPSSPFHVQSASLYLPLAPVSQGFPLEGLCAEHLSPLLLTFYPPLGGVVLSYNNVRLSERPQGEDESSDLLLQNIDEYAVSYCWVTATFLLFKPTPGVELEGYVNLQNQGHLGVVCWNLFNASIEAKRLPKGWKWVDVSEMDEDEDAAGNGNQGYAEDGIGHWVDEEGKKLEGQIKFRVKQIESSHDRERGFLSIEGTMLEVEEERALVIEENEERAQDKSQLKKKQSRGHRFAATDLSIPKDAEDEEEAGTRRHRHRY
jgi:DNA-directed RNA polymerase I subunit RPA43